ncbi:TPA: hypothetical protein ACXIGT_001329 [Serratia marcescens]|uniref:hypothetical protein n=1 Tax=Serratia bockelmannii TaxID=2703793 RepID=UPI003FA6C93C
MSYARQTVTDKQPSLTVEAANKKRAALMRKVYAARLAGELQPISSSPVETAATTLATSAATLATSAAKLAAEISTSHNSWPLHQHILCSPERYTTDVLGVVGLRHKDVLKITLKPYPTIPTETSLERVIAVEIHNALDENEARLWEINNSSLLTAYHHIKHEPFNEFHVDGCFSRLAITDSNLPMVHRYDAVGLGDSSRCNLKKLPTPRKNKAL